MASQDEEFPFTEEDVAVRPDLSKVVEVVMEVIPQWLEGWIPPEGTDVEMDIEDCGGQIADVLFEKGFLWVKPTEDDGH